VTELKFTLPWPPSVNGYWALGTIRPKGKPARGTHFLSDKGRDYRVLALAALAQQRVPRGSLKGRLKVSAVAYPPDQRTRDVDNLWKGMLDALRHAQVIDDDGNIDDLHIRRGPVREDGLVEFTLGEIPEAFESRQQGFELAPAPPPARSPAPF
jgi:crossover junction endodeoxyribonuclease RusA